MSTVPPPQSTTMYRVPRHGIETLNLILLAKVSITTGLSNFKPVRDQLHERYPLRGYIIKNNFFQCINTNLCPVMIRSMKYKDTNKKLSKKVTYPTILFYHYLRTLIS
jgi:hypothetical protein